MTQTDLLQNQINRLLSEKGLLEKFIHVSHEMLLRGKIYRRIGNPDFIKLGIFPNHYYRNCELIRVWNDRLKEVTEELNNYKDSFDGIEELKNRLSYLFAEKTDRVKTREKLLTFRKRLISLELYYADEHLEYTTTKEMDELVGLSHKSHPIPIYIAAIAAQLALMDLTISELEDQINDLSADLFCVGELSDKIEKEDEELITFQENISDNTDEFFKNWCESTEKFFSEEHRPWFGVLIR